MKGKETHDKKLMKVTTLTLKHPSLMTWTQENDIDWIPKVKEVNFQAQQTEDQK